LKILAVDEKIAINFFRGYFLPHPVDCLHPFNE